MKVAFVAGAYVPPVPRLAWYRTTMCRPAWNPTPMKLMLKLPAEFAAIPFVVLTNGENRLSIATK